MKEIGDVTNYFANIGVAAIMLTQKLKVGDKIKIEGATTDFEQEVDSMEYEREQIEEGNKGQEIAIKTKKRVREGDKVYLL
ncbi:translation elongation factor-like protein [Candidatus Thorarchaeota archaeon]|nr:MAG: translation elongation factor-like protein [Candidatus Thorarchaeota archaeon]